MKIFGLGVFKENGEFKECSEEFLESIDKVPFAEVNFDISNIESHHPTTYFGVDLSMELDATNVQNLREALRASRKTSTQTVTVYKDYIDTRVYIRRDLFTNRRICAATANSFVATLRSAIRNAALEATNTPVLSITLVLKRFGRKKKKRIKKQLGGLPLRPIIAKLFMEQLWLEVENCSRDEAWKAFWGAQKTYIRVEEARATPEYKAKKEACEAMEATPEYKAFEKAEEAYTKACKAYRETTNKYLV